MTAQSIGAACLAVGIGIVTLPGVVAAPVPAADRFWAQWRGPYASGVSRYADPPIEWGETKNIRWKIAIPGLGSGTPVVWGDRIFVLTAVPAGPAGDAAPAPTGRVRPKQTHRFVVMAINRRDGRVVWERIAREEAVPEATRKDNGNWASASAITDGEHVIAFFESRGLYVYDMEGNLVWERDFGDKKMVQDFREGNTPALYGDRLVVVWDHQGQSFIVTLDKRTGREIWRADRDEIETWPTPLVVAHDGRAQVVTSGMNRLRSYDLETGEIIWHCEGVGKWPVPSPVFGNGMIFVTGGSRGNFLKAIRLDGAHGDITGTDRIVWTLDRDAPYVPSPLLYDGILYLLKQNSGILTAYDAATGTPHYHLQRLEGVPNVFASPVGARGRVYIAGRDGTTLVIRHGPTYEVLASNTLDDGFDASPALVDREIFLRGARYLYSIAAP